MKECANRSVKKQVRVKLSPKMGHRSSAEQYFGELVSPRDTHVVISKRKFGQIIDSLSFFLLQRNESSQDRRKSGPLPHCERSQSIAKSRDNTMQRKNGVINPQMVMGLITKLHEECYQTSKRNCLRSTSQRQSINRLLCGKSPSKPSRNTRRSLKKEEKQDARDLQIDSGLESKEKNVVSPREGFILKDVLFEVEEGMNKVGKETKETNSLVKSRQRLNEQIVDLEHGIEALIQQSKREKNNPLMKRVSSIENHLPPKGNENTKMAVRRYAMAVHKKEQIY